MISDPTPSSDHSLLLLSIVKYYTFVVEDTCTGWKIYGTNVYSRSRSQVSRNDVMHAEMYVMRLLGGPCRSAFKDLTLPHTTPCPPYLSPPSSPQGNDWGLIEASRAVVPRPPIKLRDLPISTISRPPPGLSFPRRTSLSGFHPPSRRVLLQVEVSSSWPG